MANPRLTDRALCIAQAMGIDDASEARAAVDEVQVLLDRCLYHLRSSVVRRAQRRPPVRGNRANGRVTTARRGRPLGTANFAARQLGLGLALIWLQQTGRAPARNWDADKERERGDYHAFIALVLGGLPIRIRRKSKGNVPTVDYIVRTSIDDLAASQRAPEEYRRRGLIDEASWCGPAIAGSAPTSH